MWCQKGEFKDSKRRVRPTSCKVRQLTCNMGLEWIEICIHASKATTSSKVFVLSKNNNVLNPVLNTGIFSSTG
jgi:hypothetical protein